MGTNESLWLKDSTIVTTEPYVDQQELQAVKYLLLVKSSVIGLKTFDTNVLSSIKESSTIFFS
jgi:hypothetical protein